MNKIKVGSKVNGMVAKGVTVVAMNIKVMTKDENWCLTETDKESCFATKGTHHQTVRLNPELDFEFNPDKFYEVEDCNKLELID